MISEKINIIMVKTPDVTDKYSFPHNFCACTPIPTAPIVLANVLIVKIAASGVSIFSLNCCNDLANFFPSFTFTAKYDGVILSKAASRIEQTNEVTTAINKYKINKPINF